MKKNAPLLALILLTCLFNKGMAQTSDANYLDGQLFVKLQDSDTDTLNLSSPLLLPFVTLYQMNACYRPFAGLGSDTLDRIYKIKISDTAKTQLCMDTLGKLPMVDYVERVPLYRTSFVPNDPQLSNQYNLQIINAEAAWNISKGSASIVIAVVDNAVLTTHQDLAANIVAGYDVADNDNNTNPPAGFTSVFWNHGTHCAGIASAVTDNRIGIASIGYNTKIMPVKCTSDTSTSGDELDYADEGVTYAMQNGASIISMSFGSYGSSFTEQILMETAINKGIVLVSAAGNNDSSLVTYPAAYTGVICVGSTDQNDVKSSFSNYGSRIDVMAPGTSVYSTFATSDSAYSNFSGTSMACPLVAGLCALVKAQNSSFTPAQVLSAVKAGADDISAENTGFAGELGAGRINAYHALGGVGTAITSTGDAGNIKIYPNPFTNRLQLQLNTPLLPVTVQLQDMEGRTVFNQSISGNANPVIETGNLQSGLYLIKVITGNSVTSGKLVKM